MYFIFLDKEGFEYVLHYRNSWNTECKVRVIYLKEHIFNYSHVSWFPASLRLRFDLVNSSVFVGCNIRSCWLKYKCIMTCISAAYGIGIELRFTCTGILLDVNSNGHFTVTSSNQSIVIFFSELLLK